MKKEKYCLIVVSENYYDIRKPLDGDIVEKELSKSFRTSVGIAIFDYGYHPKSIKCLAEKHADLCI